MIYQEQVMQIAQELAGYSLGSADLLRRAMGKKIKSEMEAQRKNFVEGPLRVAFPKPRPARSSTRSASSPVTASTRAMLPPTPWSPIRPPTLRPITRSSSWLLP